MTLICFIVSPDMHSKHFQASVMSFALILVLNNSLTFKLFNPVILLFSRGVYTGMHLNLIIIFLADITKILEIFTFNTFKYKVQINIKFQKYFQQLMPP